MPRVEGKVALVTGAARGLGRSHAVRLAEEGADIVAVDVPGGYDAVDYPLGTAADLAETAELVRALGRRVVTGAADVRDPEALKSTVDAAVAELGRLDVVVANAGVAAVRTWDRVTPALWQEILDTNLTGVWNTCVAGIPHLITGGGSIVATSSNAGVKGLPFVTPYVAAKHGVLGIVKSLANELARHRIRVNAVLPTGTDTPMLAGIGADLSGQLEREPGLGPLFQNTLPVELLDPVDVSNAVLWLASDESRHVTGLELKVDAGNTIR